MSVNSIDLDAVVSWCDQRLNRRAFKDFKGAENGLQLANQGTITRIGASVDAGLTPIESAVARGIDFLIVHHGLFWTPPIPITAHHYRKLSVAITQNLALYSAHLPLDAHPEIGNNVQLARAFRLEPAGTFLPYEGQDIGIIAQLHEPFDQLVHRLREAFGTSCTPLLFGSRSPKKIAILTGSGNSAVDALRGLGVDTLITGELKQNHFNQAQEEQLNLIPCGHYATETYGVKALAAEVALHFNLPWEFIDTGCPL